MAQRQASRKKSPTREPRPWNWFFSGLALGALLIVSLQAAGMLDLSALARPADGAGATADTAEADTGAATPEFEFWTLLPESEVVVPDVPEYAPAEQAPGDAPDRVYLLQAGSFRSHADADRLRARLLLMGLDVQIERFDVARGDTWHRVQTGPYESRRDANAARNRLADAGIDVIVLKRRAPR